MKYPFVKHLVAYCLTLIDFKVTVKFDSLPTHVCITLHVCTVGYYVHKVVIMVYFCLVEKVRDKNHTAYVYVLLMNIHHNIAEPT